MSESRILFYATRLWKITQWVKKDFEKMEKEDIKELIRGIEEREYKYWTKYCFKVTIKKFFQFVEGYEWNSKEYPEKVKWLRLSKKNTRKLPEEILTKEEVLRLIEKLLVEDYIVEKLFHEENRGGKARFQRSN